MTWAWIVVCDLGLNAMTSRPAEAPLWYFTETTTYISGMYQFTPKGRKSGFLSTVQVLDNKLCSVIRLQLPGNNILWIPKNYRI